MKLWQQPSNDFCHMKYSKVPKRGGAIIRGGAIFGGNTVSSDYKSVDNTCIWIINNSVTGCLIVKVNLSENAKKYLQYLNCIFFNQLTHFKL